MAYFKKSCLTISLNMVPSKYIDVAANGKIFIFYG